MCIKGPEAQKLLTHLKQDLRGLSIQRVKRTCTDQPPQSSIQAGLEVGLGNQTRLLCCHHRESHWLWEFHTPLLHCDSKTRQSGLHSYAAFTGLLNDYRVFISGKLSNSSPFYMQHSSQLTYPRSGWLGFSGNSNLLLTLDHDFQDVTEPMKAPNI